MPLATFEQADVPAEVCHVNVNHVAPVESHAVTQEKQEMLKEIAENHELDLSPEQREQLYDLLLSYSAVIASSNNDLEL